MPWKYAAAMAHRTSVAFSRKIGTLRRLIEAAYSRSSAEASSTSREFTGLLPRLATRLRTLRDLQYERSLTESRALVHELEAVIMLYRAENGRARGIDPRKVPAFAEPVTLDLDVEAEASAYQVGQRRDPADYDRRRQALQSRFEEARSRLIRVTS